MSLAKYPSLSGATLALILFSSSVSAETFVVTNTDAFGVGSLHWAIQRANNTPGEDRIEFNIPGEGPHIIGTSNDYQLRIADSVVIDGYSQAGAVPATATEPAQLMIAVEGPGEWADGISFGHFVNEGLSLEIRGLSIYNFKLCVQVNQFSHWITLAGNHIGLGADGSTTESCTYGIAAYRGLIGGTEPAERNVIAARQTGILALANAIGDLVVSGNFIGTDPTGSVDLGGGSTGITAEYTIVGGSEPGAGNLISGWLHGIYATDSQILGNRIGTDVTGTVAIPNSFGISAQRNNVIGNATPGGGNLIAGNGYGISIVGVAPNNTIQGNLIGTDASGMAPLGNGGGVGFRSGSYSFNSDSIVGGAAPGEGNVIAFNNGFGVLVDGAFARRMPTDSIYNVAILGNSIYANENLGIDLSISHDIPDGVTANDSGDAGTIGGNRLQNYPVLSTATTNGSSNVSIDGALNSLPDTTDFRIEFFSSAVCNALPDGSPDPDISADFGEGENYLGAVSVDTDTNGNALFSVMLPAAVPDGNFITATATGPYGTSEFSKCLAVELLTAEQRSQWVIDELQAILDGEPEEKVADKIGKALEKLDRALEKFAQSPPDNEKAVKEIAKAVKEIGHAVEEGLDAEQGAALTAELVTMARDLAVAAIGQAMAEAGDPDHLEKAQQRLADGDLHQDEGEFEKAVKDYAGAIKEAEKAMEA